MSGRMLGRLGWHGQCACCNGPRGKRQEKRAEERQWRRDAGEPDDQDATWDGGWT